MSAKASGRWCRITSRDFAELFLFLMVAMTYISAIAERNVFLRINAWLVSAGFGLRAVFWTTGALAFLISPVR